MGDRFSASTQYDDLVGGAAFDGHDGPPLFELAKLSNMVDGYWPIGLELFRLDPDEDGRIPFTVLAVKCEEAGSKIDNIIDYAKTAPILRVYRFDGSISPNDFNLFKRIDIKVVRKDIPQGKIDLCFPPDDTCSE